MKASFATITLGILLFGGLSVAQEPTKITPEEQLDILTTILKAQQEQAEATQAVANLNAKIEALRTKYQCPDCIVNSMEGTISPRSEPPAEE